MIYAIAKITKGGAVNFTADNRINERSSDAMECEPEAKMVAAKRQRVRFVLELQKEEVTQ